jgi:hypothetical protein
VLGEPHQSSCRYEFMKAMVIFKSSAGLLVRYWKLNNVNNVIDQLVHRLEFEISISDAVERILPILFWQMV